ncbi:MAG: Si-specific NAD(P)(+) transhydrogenase [Deltaproteobacteria bacterium]|nr:Si-specific NAD(P)(+) transhydrogenase [Deltaproteobacteria bacterium]
MSGFDVVILGGGPAGERAAIQAAKLGKKAALVERENVVGGTGVNWGAIPSKTLRESALFVRNLTAHKLHGIECSIAANITIPEFMHRERVVVARELELINRSLDRWAVEIIRGHGHFLDPHTIGVRGVGGQTRLQLNADHVVIAVGSHPNRPADIDFDGEVAFDSGSILRLPRMPRSVVVLGAGVIGVEYAAIFAALGLQVTLVDTRPELLPYLDREVASILEHELKRLGIVIIHDDTYEKVLRLPGAPPAVRIHTRAKNTLEADVLLYCVGRTGNTADLGLERIGVTPNDRGLIPVNADFQTSAPHVYAVGDVVGYPALASTSMEQGRLAVRHAFGAERTRRAALPLPVAIYAIPEVSYIGATEQELEAQGEDIVIGRGNYGMNPRGQILGDTGGLLKLIFAAADLRLLGAHMVGAQASEIIHIGQAFLYGRATAHEIMDTLYNYPTLSDLYRHAALDALAVHRQRSRAPAPAPDLEST